MIDTQKYTHGLFYLDRKRPIVWKGTKCLFLSYKEAYDFWKNEGMAWGFRNPRFGIYIYQLKDGKKNIIAPEFDT